MFRPVFRATLRQGASAASRSYSTARSARALPRTKLAALTGVSIVASMGLFLPGTLVNNEINEEKVQQDILLAENAAKAEKTAFELAEEAEKLAQAAESEVAAFSAAPETEKSVEKVEKLEKTIELAENAAEAEKTAFELAEEAEKLKQSAETESAPEVQKTEESGSQSAAFNPETGEINWDCPCLGGMAHGPCGEEFKAAFACFVYSETEPKGIDCIGKFEAMRTCFRQHPEHYKEELYDDGEAVPSTGEKETSGAAPSKPVEKAEKDVPATEDISKVA